MPICIHCRHPIATLYTTYSKADDRALGKGVRLTQCPNCKNFADKYVEHDSVILFIDLVLIKPEVLLLLSRTTYKRNTLINITQVYRHLLFNRLSHSPSHFDRSIVRLGILLLLFDVYLTWARIEKLPLPLSSPHHPSSTSRNVSASSPLIPPHDGVTNAVVLQAQPLILQYLFFLALVTFSTVAFHMPIRVLCGIDPVKMKSVVRRVWEKIVPFYPHPTRLSTALLVSSCTKLFPILLIIWDYDLPSSATAVSWAVIVNNIAALEILMNCGYVRASILVGVGAGLRSAVGWGMLWAVGMGTGWEGYDALQSMRDWIGEMAALT